MANVTIPETHYIGIKLKRHDIEEGDLPLGFMTPEGDNAQAKKRKGTVNDWIHCGHSHSQWIDNDKLDQFLIDNPTASARRPRGLPNTAYGAKTTDTLVEIPFEEGVDFNIIENSPNTPRKGFRITKSVARCGWNGGNKLVRIEDPRGFELEISVANLVKVMSMSTFIDGVCQTECVWGRDGANNTLLPVNSEPYKEAFDNTVAKNKKTISLRELKFGDMVKIKASTYGGYGYGDAGVPEITGEYLGLYNMYAVCELHEKDRIKYMPSAKFEFIKNYKRYVIRSKDEKGNDIYIGYPKLNVISVHARTVLEKGIERPEIIDPAEYVMSSYMNDNIAIMAITTANVDPVKIAKTAKMVPFENDITAELTDKESFRHSWHRNAWALDEKDGSFLKWNPVSGCWMRGKRPENENALFYGDVTVIKANKNQWFSIERRGQNNTIASNIFRKDLVVEDFTWHKLQVTINDEIFTLPLDGEPRRYVR